MSKRKSSQGKSKPLSGRPSSGSVSSAMKTAESPLVKSVDTGKAAPAADRKKKPKKG